MLENLKSLDSSGNDKRIKVPKESWRPHLELDSDGGYFVSSARKVDEQPEHAELLAEFDLNPSEWVVTSVRRSKWQAFDGEWLQAFRVNLLPKNSRGLILDAGAIEDEILKWRPPKGSKQSTGNLAALFVSGDTQWGKDAGDGTSGTVARVMSAIEASKRRMKYLSKEYQVGEISIPQIGDCIEGTVSQNGKIVGRLDLPLTEQVRLGRRVLLEWVKALAPLVEKVTIPTVPGNHDESHRQVLTDPMDSWQVEIVQQVADICKENKDLQHVTAMFGEADSTTLAVNYHGTLVGYAHGHQIRNIEKWFSEQALGRQPVGDADVLVTAHFHHYHVQQFGERLWVQIPAMDGGSPWFRDRRGMDSPHGVVSMVLGEGFDPRRELVVLQ